MKTTIELQPCASCGGEVRSSLHKCDPKVFARHNAKKLGEKTLRVIGKILAKHDAGIIEAALELEGVARDNGDTAAMRQARLDSIKEIIDGIENRCMAADGPVTNTRHEMSDEELRRIYRLAGGTTAK
jgi:hypothetical protein